MNVESLCGLNMHDSELLELIIDRVDKKADLIVLVLNYIEDYESMSVSRKKLAFYGCYKAVLDMNFGVIAEESINTGYEIEDSILLDELTLDFAKVGINLVGKLKHFRIETNSTGSVIDIVAERVELLDVMTASTPKEQAHG